MDMYTRHHDGQFAKAGEAVSADARRAAKQAQIAARAGSLANPITVQKPLHRLFTAYIAHLERKGSAKTTVDRNRYALARHDKWLKQAEVEATEVSEVMIEEYFAWLGSLAQTTANSEATMIRSAYRYGVRMGMIDTNPAEHAKVPSVDEAEVAVYTNEELRLIRHAVTTDLEEAIFYGLVYTGLRRFELCKLKRELHADIDRNGNKVNYVDFERQEIKVVGKGGKLRTVPLHPTLAEVWTAHLKRNPNSRTILGRGGSWRNVNERLEQLLNRAGVDGGNRPAHKLRATVQTVLYEEGVATDVIDKILGWAPSSVRQRYYSRVRDETMHDGILKLYASDPIERPPFVTAVQTNAVATANVAAA